MDGQQDVAGIETEGVFPTGGGELGALIRRFDWASTSLGPIASWPQSLRTATEIVLRSPLPLVMLWGPDGIMIYNDAYSGFAGKRHPRLLGSKVLEGWAEVADFNAEVMRVGLAGRTLSFKDQELTLYRNNRAEQVWMDLNYSPVIDESGKPAGVLAIVIETTGRVLAERRNALLFELGERVRDMTLTADIAACAAEVVGKGLRVDRAGWLKTDDTDGRLTVRADWTAGDRLARAPPQSRQAFSESWMAGMEEGRPLRIDDVAARPDAELVPGPSGGVQAALTIPILREGRLAACLFVQHATPRVWTDEEVTLARDLAERTWGAIQRALALARVRESEARFRALVNATSDVVYQLSPDWTEMRALDGRGFLSDTDSPSVAWMDEYLYPEDQPAIRAVIHDAVARRDVFQTEHRVRRMDGTQGWTFSRAIPLFDAHGQITDWFGAASDITARREAEEHLRLVVNELNHRVKNNLAMIQAISAQTFRNADDLPSAEAKFTARILALGRANDLLTDEHWVDASLKEVVESALRAHRAEGPGRCTIAGPPLRLSAKTALSMSMALHELATNAVKYGAWSNDVGKVAVTWSVSSDPGGERLSFEWREIGGPPVAPPRRRGFGSRLIERGLAAEMEGDVALRFEPDGLVCGIDALLRPMEEAATP